MSPFGKRMRHRAFTGELSGRKWQIAIMQVVIFIFTWLIFVGWFFFFCRFTMIHSVKKRVTGHGIGQKKKNATMQRHSKEECKPCILPQGQPAMLHSSSEILPSNSKSHCSIMRQKKNATMQRHSRKNANSASFLKDNLQCCTLHLKYFR